MAAFEASELISVLAMPLAFFPDPSPISVTLNDVEISKVSRTVSIICVWLPEFVLVLSFKVLLRLFLAASAPQQLECFVIAATTQPRLTRFSHLCPFYLLLSQNAWPTEVTSPQASSRDLLTFRPRLSLSN